MLAQGEAGVCPVHLRRPTQGIEAGGLGTGQRPGCGPVEGRTAPRAQRGGELGGRSRRLPFQQLVRLRHRHLEPARVDLGGSSDQPIGRAAGHNPAREQAPQCGDLGLQRVLSRGRRLVAPQLVDESVPGDEPVGLHQEGGQERPRPGSTEAH